MKNKGTAVVLTLFFGGFGIHQFYLGKSLKGLLYLLFFWTLIPAILAVIDFFILAFMDENKFNKKYNSLYFVKNPLE
jgi:TM2 domain-containing membrane protein YozV